MSTRISSSVDALDAARERLRTTLELLLLECDGLPLRHLRGQLIRPLVAHAGALGCGSGDDRRVALAGLAVQLAHEASLVHDDIVDGAATRRGEPTLAASAGTGAALVAGDHLLAWAYRLAAQTGSLVFADLFANAVERTIAGEMAQGRATGRALTPGAYEAIALDKAGALLGCALAAAPAVLGRGDVDAHYQLGRALGLLYQRVDDLLDYCPDEDTGKPALGDHMQRRWTWVLEEVPGADPWRDTADMLAALRAPDSRGTPLNRLLARLDAEFDDFERRRAALLPRDTLLAALAAEWRERAHAAVDCGEIETQRSVSASTSSPRRIIRERVPASADLARYFSRNSRSFAFAARFFPEPAARTVGRVYAYCRVTDDLVDRADDEASAAAVLDEWVDLSRRAYEGGSTGIALLDETMGEMALAGVPFVYASELAEGMRMDLRREMYPTSAALRVYTHRVAGVVGMWLTEQFGVRDAATLSRAAEMGHAMQLTNILRDVGEDARAGRIYLPQDAMRRHGVTADELREMCGGRPISQSYMHLVDELMRAADGAYDLAFAAIPRLPAFFQRPVAVAAGVYRGIHREIRRNGYDNLRRRAHTSSAAKALLAVRALYDLRSARRSGALQPLAEAPAR